MTDAVAVTPTWRQMTADDIGSLLQVADMVHPGLPEKGEVFAERVKLFPEGCLALVKSGPAETESGMNGDVLCGYVVSHPICQARPPALDTFLMHIDPGADQYYIHDLAILSSYRGRGLAADCMAKLSAVAVRFPTTCLVSVYGTSPFWARFGFAPESVDEILAEKLKGYGDDAVYLLRKNRSIAKRHEARAY